MATQQAGGGERREKAGSPSDEAREYLEQKYGESFTYLGAWDTGFSSTHALRFSSESRPEETVLVEYTGREKADFRDNYLAILYARELRELVRERVMTVFSDARVFYQPAMLVPSEAIPADASLEEYLRLSDVLLYISVEVPAAELKSLDRAREAADAFAETGACCSLMLFSMKEGSFGLFSEEEIKEKLASGDFAASATFVRDRGFSSETWKEGNGL